MKILAGRFGGIDLKTSSKLSYRPTKSRVRKSIFDTLRPFNFISVLDLFSGSGIFGFESASRGADSITFVENNKKTLELLVKNSKILDGPEFLFHKADALRFLNKSRKYDLIFADPPYLKYDIVLLAKRAIKKLNKNGKFILECNSSEMPFMDAKKKNYGATSILFWDRIWAK